MEERLAARKGSLTEREARVLLYRLGADAYRDRVLLAWSRAWPDGVDSPAWERLATVPVRWTAPAFPIRAADFLARGIAKGPGLGRALRGLARVLSGKTPPKGRLPVSLPGGAPLGSGLTDPL